MLLPRIGRSVLKGSLRSGGGAANTSALLPQGPAQPPPARPSSILGTGNFVATVLITEYDDYGKKVKEAAETLEDNRDKIVKKISE